MATPAPHPSHANQAAPAPPAPDAPMHSRLATDPDMAELIHLFVDEIPDRIRSLEDLWSRRELDELRRTAHQLKGASGGYGFPELGAVAAVLEDQLRAPIGSHSDAALASVASSVRELVSLCKRLRAD